MSATEFEILHEATACDGPIRHLVPVRDVIGEAITLACRTESRRRAEALAIPYAEVERTVTALVQTERLEWQGRLGYTDEQAEERAWTEVTTVLDRCDYARLLCGRLDVLAGVHLSRWHDLQMEAGV